MAALSTLNEPANPLFTGSTDPGAKMQVISYKVTPTSDETDPKSIWQFQVGQRVTSLVKESPSEMTRSLKRPGRSTFSVSGHRAQLESLVRFGFCRNVMTP